MQTKGWLLSHHVCCPRLTRQTGTRCFGRVLVCHAKQVGSGCTPILLPDKAGHGQVFLFGVEHNSQQVEPAHFILERKPAVAVFENSFSAGGGNGAVVSCTDSKSLDGSALVTMACATAARMQTSPGPVFQHVWQ